MFLFFKDCCNNYFTIHSEGIQPNFPSNSPLRISTFNIPVSPTSTKSDITFPVWLGVFKKNATDKIKVSRTTEIMAIFKWDFFILISFYFFG